MRMCICEDVHVCNLKNRLYFASQLFRQSYKTNPRMGSKLLCVMGGRR